MTGVPREGDVLAGKYRVERILGQGGMGVVVQAHHLQLDERVAMKFLLPEYAMHHEAAARFLREARAAVKIKSEHVARVVDVGTLETGAPYMVMEYLQGSDLSSFLQQRGVFPPEEAIEYVLQACEAVAEAHAAGIVHRDLKPANLFLTKRADGSPVVKVLDFGISKVVAASDSGGAVDASLTKTSAMMGSPLYMSPEQMRSSRDVDARADIWSLGAILYELVCGQPPFTGDSLPQICAAILADPPPPLSARRPDLPPALEPTILRCLAKNPAERFPTIADLAVALLQFAPRRGRTSVERISKVISAAGLGATDLSIPSSHTERPPPAAETHAAWGQTAGGSGRSSAPVAIAVVAVLGILVIGGGAAAFAYQRMSAPPATAASASAAVEEPAPEPAPSAEPPPSAAATGTTAGPVVAPAASSAPVAAGPPPVAAVAPTTAPVVRTASRTAAKPAPKQPPAPAAAPPPAPAPAPPPAAPAPKSRTAIFGDRK